MSLVISHPPQASTNFSDSRSPGGISRPDNTKEQGVISGAGGPEMVSDPYHITMLMPAPLPLRSLGIDCRLGG